MVSVVALLALGHDLFESPKCGSARTGGEMEDPVLVDPFVIMVMRRDDDVSTPVLYRPSLVRYRTAVFAG